LGLYRRVLEMILFVLDLIRFSALWSAGMGRAQQHPATGQSRSASGSGPWPSLSSVLPSLWPVHVSTTISSRPWWTPEPTSPRLRIATLPGRFEEMRATLRSLRAPAVRTLVVVAPSGSLCGPDLPWLSNLHRVSRTLPQCAPFAGTSGRVLRYRFLLLASAYCVVLLSWLPLSLYLRCETSKLCTEQSGNPNALHCLVSSRSETLRNTDTTAVKLRHGVS
jgi:hypothetical protein